jgi:hypothetical protein
MATADLEVSYGYCNAVALMASLGDYAKSWNGDDLKPGDWDFIEANAASGDLKELCKIVVQMHEGPGSRPFLPRPSSSTAAGANDSPSHAA